jgi:tetratricopeptide (TPR) repeat protein
MASELGLDELRAHSLTTIGMAKNDSDFGSGDEDMQHALEIALAADSPYSATIVNNLAVYATQAGDFPRTEELYAEALRLGERYGDAGTVRFVRGNVIWLDYMLGRWDRALESANDFIAECEAGSPHTLELFVREERAGILLARGDLDGALRDLAQVRGLVELRSDALEHLGRLALTAALYADLDQTDEARVLAAQIPSLVREVGLHGALMRLAPIADDLGIGDELRDAAAAGAGPAMPLWRSTIELILAGDLVAAAVVMASTGIPNVESSLRKHAGLRLLAVGRTAEATVELDRALVFYRSVDARAYVAEIENALAGAQRDSA